LRQFKTEIAAAQRAAAKEAADVTRAAVAAARANDLRPFLSPAAIAGVGRNVPEAFRFANFLLKRSSGVQIARTPSE
jgi:hypothetical protein